MPAEPVSLVETGTAAVLFALTFLFGGRVHPLKAIALDRRGLVSFSAGMSAAYVFVHLMPELHAARGVLAGDRKFGSSGLFVGGLQPS